MAHVKPENVAHRTEVLNALKAGNDTCGKIARVCPELTYKQVDHALQGMKRQGKIAYDKQDRCWRIVRGAL